MKRPFLKDPKFMMLSSSSLAACVMASAVAQGAETEKDMEVISVYAQKRPQAIKDVSVAVSQVNGEILEAQHFKDSTEIGLFEPNINNDKCWIVYTARNIEAFARAHFIKV